ncbi:MAG: protein TolQ [Pseudomonadota bacterium]|nr:protein TolQ [Pseudomonadota bacterium]
MDPVLPVYLASVAATDDGFSIFALVMEADFIVQSVLFLLLAMSVACWAIILNKYLAVRRASVQSQAFLDAFWKAGALDDIYARLGRYPAAPVGAVFKSGYDELKRLTTADAAGGMDLGLTENIERALRRTANTELNQLERLIPVLATTGSTGPFIGLFGTVWGILRAFQKIGVTGQASIQTVGPDIAHALVATAVGLLAAIPAVMAYNFFNSRIRGIASEMDGFSSDFLNIVKRHYRGR